MYFGVAGYFDQDGRLVEDIGLVEENWCAMGDLVVEM